MHVAIDILVALFLVFFFFSGWHRGFLLSSLGIARVILAYGMAYFAGRHLGPWLAGVLYRPRIVMIPVVAGLTFTIITFGFYLIMGRVRSRHHSKTKEEEHYHLPYSRCFMGGLVNMTAGLLSLIFIFWLGDLLLTGISGRGIPGGNQSIFGRFAHRATYEAVYLTTAKKGRESQAAALARVISHPAKGLVHLQRVLEAESIRQLFSDRQLADDLMSGDAERIRNNTAMQRLLNDRETRAELQELGIISRHDTKADLCQQLARFGQNEKIRSSIQNLKSRNMFRTEKIILLVRDPEFDVVVKEIME